MANEYKEFSKLLADQQTELGVITRNLAQLTNPGQSPLDIDIEGISRMELTPDNVNDLIHTIGREDEAMRSLHMVNACLDKMKITMALLKAQETLTWIADTEKSQQARDCYIEDNKMMGPLAAHLAKLKQDHENRDLPITLDRQSFFDHFNGVVDDYANFMKQPVSAHIQTAQDFKKASSVQSLIETIYELRLDYLDRVIGDSAVALDSMTAKLHEAATIHLAIDEGILPDSKYARQQIAERLDYCRKSLPTANENLAAINRFMGQLYEMGDDDWGTKDFEVKEYRPVALSLLPVISP